MMELIIVTAIVSLVVSTVGMSIYQVVRLPREGREHMTSVLTVQNASHVITRDLQSAQTTDLVDNASAVNSMTLDWVDYYTGVNESHTASYSLSGTDLQRDFDGTITTIATGVTGIQFSRSGRVVMVTIITASKQSTFSVMLRPVESQV